MSKAVLTKGASFVNFKIVKQEVNTICFFRKHTHNTHVFQTAISTTIETTYNQITTTPFQEFIRKQAMSSIHER
jgi:hypothetical protein